MWDPTCRNRPRVVRDQFSRAGPGPAGASCASATVATKFCRHRASQPTKVKPCPGGSIGRTNWADTAGMRRQNEKIKRSAAKT